MKEIFVLDACSIIALLKEENGSNKVKQILQQSMQEAVVVLLHKVTLAEVVYDLLRSGDYTTADEIFNTCYNLPIKIVDDLSDILITEVAH